MHPSNLDEYEDDDNVDLLRSDNNSNNNQNHDHQNNNDMLFEGDDNFGELDTVAMVGLDEEDDEPNPNEDQDENADEHEETEEEILRETSLSELRRNLIDATNTGMMQPKSTNRRKNNRKSNSGDNTQGPSTSTSSDISIKKELLT
jgi:hypothetical protein